MAARIVEVAPESPADDAGFTPGCAITAVDGQPLRDIIDWRWLSADAQIELAYEDAEGDSGEVELFREEGEDWGFTFDGVIFDEVKLCRNACKFCFMRQLPEGMRPSLSMRDDDFRLSFLTGTFVTLTNLSLADETRILEQRLSPLRVSLHAADHDARRQLIGKHEAHGLEALDRLLAGGIEVHAQIVLVPGMNDGAVLKRTLDWAWERPGILSIGIVPLGFTRWQGDFEHSFNDAAAARAVLATIEPYQARAQAERGGPWVFAADEFYRNAFPEDVLAHVPPASHYGDFAMFEDGIGIIRDYADEFAQACESGLAARAAAALEAADARAFYIVGEAMQPFLDQLIAQSPFAGRLEALTVRNLYFGGNVDVTGLLTATDVTRAIRAAADEVPKGVPKGTVLMATSGERFRGDAGDLPEVAIRTVPLGPSSKKLLFLLPRVMFNDDGVTLDDATATDIAAATGATVHVVSCNPLDYSEEITRIAQRL